MDQVQPPSREFVSVHIRECWDTLRRVPAHGVPGFKSQWPEVIRDAEEAYGYTAAVVRLPPASPRAIDRMYETFRWFRWLEGQRHLTLALWFTCGRGMSTHRAGAILGAHRNTIANRRNDALDLIVDGLRRDLAVVHFVRHCAVSSLQFGEHARPWPAPTPSVRLNGGNTYAGGSASFGNVSAKQRAAE